VCDLYGIYGCFGPFLLSNSQWTDLVVRFHISMTLLLNDGSCCLLSTDWDNVSLCYVVSERSVSLSGYFLGLTRVWTGHDVSVPIVSHRM